MKKKQSDGKQKGRNHNGKETQRYGKVKGRKSK